MVAKAVPADHDLDLDLVLVQVIQVVAVAAHPHQVTQINQQPVSNPLWHNLVLLVPLQSVSEIYLLDLVVCILSSSSIFMTVFRVLPKKSGNCFLTSLLTP